MLSSDGEFTEYQLDDYLGYFELMSMFKEKKVVDEYDLYTMFGHYILKAWKHDEIKAYVENLRNDNKDNSYYCGFEDLVKMVVKEDKLNNENYKTKPLF